MGMKIISVLLCSVLLSSFVSVSGIINSHSAEAQVIDKTSHTTSINENNNNQQFGFGFIPLSDEIESHSLTGYSGDPPAQWDAGRRPRRHQRQAALGADRAADRHGGSRRPVRGRRASLARDDQRGRRGEARSQQPPCAGPRLGSPHG